MTDTIPHHFEAPQKMHSYLTSPLPHLGAWTHYFVNAEIPVLACTAQALEELREKEDDVDANMLTPVIQADPLMSLKLIRLVATLRTPGVSTET